MNRILPRLIVFVSLALSFVVSAVAQSTGAITGTVLNPATKDYIRYAEVRVQGTEITATTEVGGYFRLANVPAGEVTVVVTYAGFAPASAVVHVTAGETATTELLMGAAPDSRTVDADQPIQLAAFIVSSEVEGNAKALQQQKNSMSVGRAVATDIYGEVTEGNVGEFLKYLPGVELEYVEADTRGPRLGGMASEYTSVTMDGMSLASADAFTQYVAFENSAAGASNRSFGFEQVSINSIESIEINRVTTAAMEASAPAGNINLKTKRAFDSKVRRIGFNASTVLNTEEFSLGQSVGPNDSVSSKLKPNYSLNYSDVFFNQRLGILIGVSESNLYNEQYRVDHTYNRSPTGTDTRPEVITQILLKDGPKWTERFTTTFTSDFRATDHLTLSLAVTFNSYDARFYNRQVTMQASANNTGATTGRQNVAGDGFLSYGTTDTSTAASRQVVFGGGNGVKLTNTINVIPKFEYRFGDFTFDGAFAYSYSRNDYDNFARGTVSGSAVDNLTGVGFTATRSGPDEADWQFRQTGGLDWANLVNLKNPRINDDNRKADNTLASGEVNMKWVTPLRLPTFIQIGGKYRTFDYLVSNSTPYETYRYIGPGGSTATTTTGSFAEYPTLFQIYGAGNQVGVKFTSLDGGGAPAFPNRDALGELFRTHPEYFLRNETIVTATAYEQAKYTNRRDMREKIGAAYAMANSRIRGFTLQGGVRYERTEVESEEFDPRTPTEIKAAGFATTAAGVPTTWAGMDYKYASKPMVARKGSYRNYFPSFAVKRAVLPNLLADIGWGKAIKRPNIGLLSGVWSIDDTNEVIVASNPNLKPERSEKVAAGLSYYFGRNGGNALQLVLTNTKVIDAPISRTYTSEEFGNTDETYATYDFVATTNSPAPVTYRSAEVSYNQRLSFLPSFLSGISINGAYTRTYASRRMAGVVPHSVKGGIGYSYRKVYFGFNGIWRAESPWFQGTTNRWLKSNVKFDFNAGYRLTENVSLYVQGRNIFEEPHRIYESSATRGRILFRYENYGTNWTMGVSGKF